jgi:LysM repeat protein
MRYVAITAALFGGAFFMAAGSHAPLASASNLQSTYNKPVVQTVLSVARDQALAAPAAKTIFAKAEVSAPRAATPAPAPEVQPQPVTVAVAAGDNLTKLAEATGTSYQRLYDANPVVDNPDMIYPGQQLKVPSSDEVLADRPLPDNAPVEAVAAAGVATPASRIVAEPAAAAAPVASGSVWDDLAACESGGNWAINTSNGFYGGLQFTLASWQAVGGTGMPNEASREEQINRGQILQARGGWGNWPACSAKLGLS